MAKKPYGSGEACLRKIANDNLARHQLGFRGEAIGKDVIKKELGEKGVRTTRHKAKFDVVSDDTAWEVKAVSADAKDIKMTVKTPQQKAKNKWARENGKKPKSMLIVVNDMIDVYVRDGVGGYRPSTMEHIGKFPKKRFKF
jgi:hypothetical protein